MEIALFNSNNEIQIQSIRNIFRPTSARNAKKITDWHLSKNLDGTSKKIVLVNVGWKIFAGNINPTRCRTQNSIGWCWPKSITDYGWLKNPGQNYQYLKKKLAYLIAQRLFAMRRYEGGMLYTALPLHMQRGRFRIRTHDQQVTKAQLYRCTKTRPQNYQYLYFKIIF